ncbi:MAG: YbaN family protein [Gammaproteobacteria bacterium]|nr:YbaN family protein [Gammaproteobacteria bacterium]MBU1554224.1 YbaN family protein [Gammaproteobacteria bacterium]MBU2069100.1 YbaN family protein [Gammaproteobacteria bacterium]MBU2182645.1 YbaN family protein [Gammaproteobacteria bacterium]MBU2206572.1 YbaN family protein [Gammaproteobacteria bacterium]
MLHYGRILFWRTLAVVSLLLGLIGIPLPVLPTVPFILLSAWAAGKGWPALEQRLLAHPQLGPPILAWRRYGVVPRRAKYLAGGMMLLSALLLQLSAAPLILKLLLPCTLLLIAVWLWRRPEHFTPASPQDNSHDTADN